jgi:hypothetical protein
MILLTLHYDIPVKMLPWTVLQLDKKSAGRQRHRHLQLATV